MVKTIYFALSIHIIIDSYLSQNSRNMSATIASYNTVVLPKGVAIKKASLENKSYLLNDDALQFITQLHRKFNPIRKKLLANRRLLQVNAQRGAYVTYDTATKPIRTGEWRVANTTPSYQKVTFSSSIQRIVEFQNRPATNIVDFEDQLTPTWDNLLDGQALIQQAHAQEQLTFCPRAWHREEQHIVVDNEPLAATFFDIGLYLYHNRKSTQPLRIQLPKLEHYLEARLWVKILELAQQQFYIEPNQIQVTLSIETLPAVFQIDELVWELRTYITALTCNMKNYLASFIKCLKFTPSVNVPAYDALSDEVHFVKSYYTLVAQKAKQRNLQAIADAALLDVSAAMKYGFDGILSTAEATIAQLMEQSSLAATPTNVQENQYIIPEDILKATSTELTEQALCETIKNAIYATEYSLNLDQRNAAYHQAELSRSLVWQWVHLGVNVQEKGALTLRNIKPYIEQSLEEIRANIGTVAFMERPFSESVQIFNQQLRNINFTEYLAPVLDQRLV